MSTSIFQGGGLGTAADTGFSAGSLSPTTLSNTDITTAGAIPKGAQPYGSPTAGQGGSTPYSIWNPSTSQTTYGTSPNQTINDLTYSYIAPSAFTQAAAAENAAIGSATNLVNQYLTPSLAKNQYTAPNAADYTQPSNANFSSAIQGLFNQAVQGYSTYQPAINALINQFGNNSTLNPNSTAGVQSASSAYNQAQQQYGNITPEQSAAGNTPGIVNPTNLYGSAAANFQPYVNLGGAAASDLSTLTGQNGAAAQNTAVQGLLNSPIIQNQLNLGGQAINQQASSQGLLRSGETLKELQQYGQGLAGNAIQGQETNLLADASLGASASGSIGSLYNQMNAAQMAQANAQAGLITGSQNAQFQQGQTKALNDATVAQGYGNIELGAINAGLTGANETAGILANQSQQTITAQQQAAQLNQQALQGNFNNATTSAEAQYQANQEAQQNYVNNMLNLYMAQGQVGATAAYGQGQTIGSLGINGQGNIVSHTTIAG